MGSVLGKCRLLIFIFMLTGCDSSEKLPITGNVSLHFERMSQSGMHFSLANQRKDVISFRGSYEADVGASPWDKQMECRLPGSNVWQEGPFSLVDGESQKVAVSPGEQVDLVVKDGLVEQYKGGRCRLSLRLEGGSFIKSSEFEPAGLGSNPSE